MNGCYLVDVIFCKIIQPVILIHCVHTQRGNDTCPTIRLSKCTDLTLDYTVYREIFVSLYFHEFREFCSVVKFNFAKILPCHTFYVANVDHLQTKRG